jgi:hypothetical protein
LTTVPFFFYVLEMLKRQDFATAARAFCLLCAGVLVAAAPARAQAGSIEVRAGVVASTPLVEDLVAPTAAPVRVAIAPSPLLVGAFVQPLKKGGQFEAELGWTFGSLEADDAPDGGGREIDALGVGHASVAYRHRFTPMLHARAGVGALSYRTSGDGIFEGEPAMRPFVMAGGGAAFSLARVRLSVDVFAQAHKFGTSGIRAAGGTDGSVARYGATLGVAFGGGGS